MLVASAIWACAAVRIEAPAQPGLVLLALLFLGLPGAFDVWMGLCIRRRTWRAGPALGAAIFSIGTVGWMLGGMFLWDLGPLGAPGLCFANLLLLGIHITVLWECDRAALVLKREPTTQNKSFSPVT